MRDWLPVDHPVWLVIEAVAGLDTSALHARRRVGGAGAAGYDPDMLLTVLIWGWAQGQRSSRRLERLCQESVVYRIICAGQSPDHVTISRFRKDATTAIEGLFTQVLVLCAQLGLGQLGVVALDGVKIASNASISANRTEAGLREALAVEAAKAAAEHAAADDDEDDRFGPGSRGDDVPAELSDPQTRGQRIATALADLAAHNEDLAARKSRVDDRKQARKSAAAKAEIERKDYVADWLAEVKAGRRPGGPIPVEIEIEVLTDTLERMKVAQQARIENPGRRGPKPLPVEQGHFVRRAQAALDRAVARHAARETAAAATTAATEAAAVAGPASKRTRRHYATAPDAQGLSDPKRNMTDPQSRPMPLRGGGWVQGYNCQAVTSGDGLMIATGVGDNPADATAFTDMLDKAVAAAAIIDAHRPADPDTPGSTPAGIGVLLADAGYLSEANLSAPGPDRLIATGKSRAVKHGVGARVELAEDATETQKMAHRLTDPVTHKVYKQRSHIAETPFAQAKHNLGFRRFTSRGKARATAEFAFHALVHNLMKAINTGQLTPATT